MHISHTDRRVHHVEVVWQWLLLCVWEQESSFALQKYSQYEKTSVCVRGRREDHLQHQGLTTVHFSRVSPQESRLPLRKWEVCSWVSVPRGSPGRLCQRLFLSPPLTHSTCPQGSSEEKSLHTWLVDSKRYQSAVISVSFPHSCLSWELVLHY